MKHPERAEDYLEHIVQAIDFIISFTQETDSAAVLKHDYKTQSAVIRNIEIIGEAATRIQQQSPDCVKAHPELPWIQMRNMRNRMIHNYFDIKIDVVWATIKDDLPLLKQQIAALLQR